MASGLTSSSTDSEVEAAYIDSASYAEDGDLEKARTYVTAIRILLLRESGSASAGASAQWRIDLWQKELERAQAYIEARSENDRPGPSTTLADFRMSRR